MKTDRIVDIPLYGKYTKLDFKGIFGAEFNVPIFIENDVNCSADEDIKLMRKYCEPKIRIKAAGGVRTVESHALKCVGLCPCGFLDSF